MLIIPKNTPVAAMSHLTNDEIEYFESLEAEFGKREAENAAKKAAVDSLQALCDRSLSQAIREAINPENAIPEHLLENEQNILRRLYDFQDKRNAVPSPRWENELKAQFGMR